MKIDLFLAFLLIGAHLSVQAQRTGEQFRHLLGFTLDQDSLGSVQQQLGPGKMLEMGDGGEYRLSVSYQAEGGRTKVSFESDELGGPNHWIEGFALCHQIAGAAELRTLPVLSDTHSQFLNVGGLKLGMRKGAFFKVFAQPIRWRGDTASVLISGKDPAQESDRKPQALDIQLSIRGVFAIGKLDQLFIWISRTY